MCDEPGQRLMMPCPGATPSHSHFASLCNRVRKSPSMRQAASALRSTSSKGSIKVVVPAGRCCTPRKCWHQRGRLGSIRAVANEGQGPEAIQSGLAWQRRRQLLTGLTTAGLMAVMKPEEGRAEDTSPPFTKTPSGIIIQEVIQGSGPAPQVGDTVLIDYVLRRSNGYFIYSTSEGVSFQPKDVPVGPVAFTLGRDASWIQGLQELVGGMRQGSKLRALIPAGLGYQDCDKDQPQPPTYATRRQLANHCKEPLLFEVALLRVTPGKRT